MSTVVLKTESTRKDVPPSTENSSLGALVMGGDYRGLGLVRSLGRHGIPVCVIQQSDQRLAAASRYASRTLFYPSWDGVAGVDYLLEMAAKYNFKQWLLFPTADESVRLVATHLEQIINAGHTIP